MIITRDTLKSVFDNDEATTSAAIDTITNEGNALSESALHVVVMRETLDSARDDDDIKTLASIVNALASALYDASENDDKRVAIIDAAYTSAFNALHDSANALMSLVRYVD